ncbi:ketoacyl reductase [Mycolicibacterium conceptionense]|uniref:Ketoacyl reductase n=1 Tax=Mycolicibacterium conceptionense TaxID=451644 RepID=A0A1A1ZLT3_9MYCO|nr:MULTISPECIES: SDR family oxidoreductase [Mycolicibacterium]MCW1824074.1 SDR family oxidoreductase [Mycolicibacterium senegalense]OBB04126.1 ketoacyl reductase [Mycolicibacterium conceptionense]OBF06833.1 ketoacyl reductase [Mycolicibacterium conceptionense]OBF18413.1 ketoacyl reductase [Mycolicibacterium conceptionense]OBF44475.1 ketoacyl reductase [Mycolicibacterium conceptionense]
MSLPTPTPDTRAVVTGASSGIGVALAEGLARRGYSLILVARREDRLRELAGRLAADFGVVVEIRPTDLSDRGERGKLCDELAGRAVSVLCNNAGFATYGDLASADPARERQQVELNSVAVHDLTLAVLPAMVTRGAGAILITGSTAGNQPGPNNATYAATKAFANTLAESLHTELAGTGVSCTLLAPGPVRTEYAEAAEAPNLDKLVPAALWVSAEHAADAAISGIAAGRRRVVPGLFAKVQTVSGQYTPRAVIGPVLRAVYQKVN